MSISNVLVLGISIVILICMVAFVMEMYIPLFIKLDTIQIIKPYMFLLEEEGNLNKTYENELKDKLEERGLSQVVIDLNYDGHHFGDTIEVKITGIYDQSKLVELFKRSKEPLYINYEKTLLIRKINN